MEIAATSGSLLDMSSNNQHDIKVNYKTSYSKAYHPLSQKIPISYNRALFGTICLLDVI